MIGTALATLLLALVDATSLVTPDLKVGPTIDTTGRVTPDLKVGPTIDTAGLVVPDLRVAIRAAANAQTDVTGMWNASFDTQIGRQDYTYQFQLKEDKLTGKASSANGESDIRNGKVEGNKVTFVEHFSYQGTTIVITYSGTIVSPDEIRFTRQVGEFATEEIVARRIKP